MPENTPPESFRMLLLGAPGMGKSTRLEQVDPAFDRSIVLDVEDGLRSCSPEWRAAGKANKRLWSIDGFAAFLKMSRWDAIRSAIGYVLDQPDFHAEGVRRFAEIKKGTFAEVYGARTDFLMMDSLNAAGTRSFEDVEATIPKGWERFNSQASAMQELCMRLKASGPTNVILTGVVRPAGEKRGETIDVGGGNAGEVFVREFDQILELVDVPAPAVGGAPVRAFVCRKPNRLGREFPKDRSTALNTFEPSDLAKLIEKIRTGARKSVVASELPAGLAVDF